ncbi:MAG: hypothetical protein N2484_17735 [Clostridia bacterium]|nr:hypothetical protein [Clostridia bacterium]
MIKKIKNMSLKGAILLHSQRGSMGIKEIAFALGAIVVVGIIIGGVKGNMNSWLKDVWGWVSDFITKKILNA